MNTDTIVDRFYADGTLPAGNVSREVLDFCASLADTEAWEGGGEFFEVLHTGSFMSMASKGGWSTLRWDRTTLRPCDRCYL